MNRIGSLFKKDMILGLKDVFILLELGFAVFIVIILLFLIPKDIRTEGVAHIYDTTKIVEEFVLTSMPDSDKRMGEYYVDSREELIAGMKKDKSSIGLIITANDNGTYKVDLLTQPYTKQTTVKYIDVDLEDLMTLLHPPAGSVYPMDVYQSIRIDIMNKGLKDLLPFNQQLMPPILMMMVGIMGLFAMVSLVGQERSEATMQAFRISPGSMAEFLSSKYLVILSTGFVSFSILYIPMLGFSGYFQSLLIIVLTVIMGSAFGVILGGFFENAVAAILWVLLLMIVFALPAISLYSPGFSPDWLKIIPSYHTLFGLEAAMFPDNNSHIIRQGALVLAGINVVLVPLSGIIFTLLIRKEV